LRDLAVFSYDRDDKALTGASVSSSVPIPKFASDCGASDANFGIKGTLTNL
jgi:hypothetical protein